MQVKLLGSRLKMKADVIPHKYIEKPIPNELIFKSQLSDEDISRYLERNGLNKKVLQKPEETNDISKSDIQKLQTMMTSVDGKY